MRPEIAWFVLGVAALAPVAEANGTLSGRVTDAGTGSGIPNVKIEVYAPVVCCDPLNLLGSTVTDVSGAYSVSVPAGTSYAVTINSGGYINEVFNNRTCSDGCYPENWCATACTVWDGAGARGAAIGVADGATTGGINFALDRGARVSGRVTDSGTGQGMAGVSVRIYQGRRFVATGTTDATGAYVTDGGLIAGTYTARTANTLGYQDELYGNVPCFLCDGSGGTPFSVGASGTTPNINFGLDPAGIISGTVTEAGTGLPIANATVGIYRQNQASSYPLYTVSTDASGHYTSGTGLPAGGYVVSAEVASTDYFKQFYANCTGCSVSTATPIQVARGAVTGVNFPLVHGGRISGSVTASDTGLAVLTNVQFYDTAGRLIDSQFVSSPSPAYQSHLLPPGTYFVRTYTTYFPSGQTAYADQLYNGQSCLGCNPRAGTPVSVAPGGTRSGVSFVLAPYAGAGPQITSLSPLSGPVGTVVTITGAWFFAGVTVSFNGTPAGPPWICGADFDPTPGCVQVALPFDATSGPVTVTLNGATSTADAIFTVTPGPGHFIAGHFTSFEWALSQAESHPGLDYIDVTAGVNGSDWTSCTHSPLRVTQPVVISGNPGAWNTLASYPTNQPPLVFPCPGSTLDHVFELKPGSGGSTIQGLDLFGYSDVGISVESGSDGNWIQNNWIGFYPSWACLAHIGTPSCSPNGILLNRATYPTAQGIRVKSSQNTIRNNVISGVSDAVWIGDDPIAPTGNVYETNSIQGNRIGTDPLATTASQYGNTASGITLGAGARENWIGPSNTISGNANGVALRHGTNEGNVVFGNGIGLNLSLATRVGNSAWGLFLTGGAHGNAIGGPFGGNVVAGNAAGGIILGNDTLGPAVGNWVQNNIVGLDVGQTHAVGGQGVGVGISSGSTGNLVASNVLAGESAHGVCLWGSQSNAVNSNWIGMAATGVRFANAGYGACFVNSGFNWLQGNAFGTNTLGNVFSQNSPGLVIH
jgi:5-hydroxyisourate hydrolase-like protein (transthyretin family)